MNEGAEQHRWRSRRDHGRRLHQPLSRHAASRRATLSHKGRGENRSVKLDVHYQFHPRANSADPSRGLSVLSRFALASLILFWIWTPLGWIGTLLTVWCALFFRDPVRVTPVREGIVCGARRRARLDGDQVLPPAELGLGDRPLPPHFDIHEACSTAM